MGAKRKSSTQAANVVAINHPTTPILLPIKKTVSKPAARPASRPRLESSRRATVDTNPDHNAEIVDGQDALRASPDAGEKVETFDTKKVNGYSAPRRRTNGKKAINYEEEDGYEEAESPLSDLKEPGIIQPPAKRLKRSPTKSSIAAKKASDEIKAFKAEQGARKAALKPIKTEVDEDAIGKTDPEWDDGLLAEDIDAVRREATRLPPMNSDYLPLPWKGRLGYVRLLEPFKVKFPLDTKQCLGLPEYISSILKSSNLYVANM